jgi:hypothetical protein
MVCVRNICTNTLHKEDSGDDDDDDDDDDKCGEKEIKSCTIQIHHWN